MKRLSEQQGNLLFEWVKNWYPTEVKPKIAILLLNEKEWRRFYVQLPRTSSEEFNKRLEEKIRELPDKIQNALRQIAQLPKNQKRQLIKEVLPHFSEEEQDINYWMNESMGKCFSMKQVKYMQKLLKQDIPDFFKPYMNHDFVIIISTFFNEEQKKKVKTRHHRNMIIYATIFHELIHVVEQCTETRILSQSQQENDKITLHLASKYLEGY